MSNCRLQRIVKFGEVTKLYYEAIAAERDNDVDRLAMCAGRAIGILHEVCGVEIKHGKCDNLDCNQNLPLQRDQKRSCSIPS